MSGDLTKGDKRKVRQLAGIAWERELRQELRKIAAAIKEMENGSLSLFDINDRIHLFHNEVSPDLYLQYADGFPWLGICRAYCDRVLTEEDLVGASDEVQNGIRTFAASLAKLDSEAAISDEDGRKISKHED